jgi:hypothetical protein
MIFRPGIRHVMCLIAILLPGIAGAQEAENDCPRRLASVPNDRVASTMVEVIVDIYEKLGCPVEIVNLPGRRGFIAFNQGLVDGEVFRFPVATENYSRPFVQSTVPLVEISNSIWAAPGSKRYSDSLLGYVIGLAWQEKYIADNPAQPASGHLDVADLISHYNMGTFDRFLAEDNTIRLAIQNNSFEKDLEPVQLETVKIGAVYHYLGAEFAPFMQRLSEHIAENPLFGHDDTM